VRIVREPKQQDYGMVAVFADLYGNRWDLLQLTLACTRRGLANKKKPRTGRGLRLLIDV